jgi:anthranilate synthase/aminodeoxychorismate synthase-like glutamine amidotransferase
VCLGHQCIGAAFGAEIVRAEPVHGKVSRIRHGERDLFSGLPSPLIATRYHSLVIDPDSLPHALIPTAWTSGGLLMALRHRTLPVWGVQFHPEAVLTQYGHAILRNFLALGRDDEPPGLAPGLPEPESPALPEPGAPEA